ncbi:cytochrome P450 [Prauserella cavernicola]|uniref:Cytochrome P450 n=1 Tax=Prauserella cavernicola TaxID=2800127 RepID=A0A934QTB0_9PSEU|nr:cytochrome P450 [Prauserella cavernicola]MBK1787867.1 cytochrome P450 [Prauserella cavernicola]
MTLPTTRAHGCPFDPPPELAPLEPITPLRYPDGHLGWLVTGFTAARTVLSDPRFSNRPELRHIPVLEHVPEAESVTDAVAEHETDEAMPGWFVNMDRPEHTRYRRLLTRYFTRNRLAALEPRIEEITAAQLRVLADAGRPADLVSTFAMPISSTVICELLGVPYADHERFQEWTRTVVDLEAPRAEADAAFEALYGYLADLVRDKRTRAGDDMLGELVATGELTDEELASIAMILLVAGYEPTANMIALGAFALLEHPAQLAQIRADPAIADNAFDELMRYLTIAHQGAPNRAALEDVEVAGVLVSAGQTVTVSLPAANRDGAAFPDPDELDLTRAEAGRHLGFGHGLHQCLGQHLAKIQVRIAYLELFAAFPALRLAVPATDVPLREHSTNRGVRELLVTW